MISHQYSKKFKKDTDHTFKDEEFEKKFGEFMVAFIECYPHYIQKEDIPHLPGEEMWIFKFLVDDNNPNCIHEWKYKDISINKDMICKKCGAAYGVLGTQIK